MKALFENHNITFDNKETVLELNSAQIEATFKSYRFIQSIRTS